METTPIPKISLIKNNTAAAKQQNCRFTCNSNSAAGLPSAVHLLKQVSTEAAAKLLQVYLLEQVYLLQF
jgi:hypothetical protein